MKSVLPYMRHRDIWRPCEDIKGRQRLNGTAVRNDDRHQTLEKARNGVSPWSLQREYRPVEFWISDFWTPEL